MTVSLPSSPTAASDAADQATRIGVVSALTASSMLFASLASAYLVRRSFVDWRPSSSLWPFVLLALALAASFGMEIAVRARGATRFAGLAILGGGSVAYLMVAVGALVTLLAGEAGLGSPHRAFVFLLVGLHVVHAIAGGAFSLWILQEPHAMPLVARLSLSRLVTHFLTAALAVIVFLLFVVQ